MAKDKNNGVSIADIIGLFGLALLMIGTVLGSILKNEGDIAMGVIVGLLIGGVAFLLLRLLKYAKTVDNNFKTWRVVEYSTLAVYIILAVASTWAGVAHFSAVCTQQRAIKQAAKDDLEQIKETIKVHNKHYENTITNYENSFLNMCERGHINKKYFSSELYEYLKKIEVMDEDGDYLNKTNIANYIKKEKSSIPNFEDILDRVETEFAYVENWDWMNLAFLPTNLDELYNEIQEQLNKKGDNEYPQFIYDASSGKYLIDKPSNKKFSLKESEVVEALKNAKGGLGMALVIILLFHIAILWPYFWAYRSHKVNPTAKSGDVGGINIEDLLK